MGTVFEVFFDGDCPLCKKEISLLRWLDRHHRIQFTDIAAADFDAAAVGSDYETLMGTIHGRLQDGRWVTGVEVFRQLYGSVGFQPFIFLTRLPGISQLLDAMYKVFAKNRLSWTGRHNACDKGTCKI